MSKIPAPLFYLWAAITLPVVITGSAIALQVHNLPVQQKTVVQKEVVTPTSLPTASPSAKPTIFVKPGVRVIVPSVTGGVK